jgi:hypothetical protein
LKDYSWKKNRMSFGGVREPSPCLNCQDRHEGCHSDCPDDKYPKWKAANDIEHAKVLEKKHQMSDTNGHAIISVTRYTGRKPKAY